MHHAFLYISLLSLHDYDVIMPQFTFVGGHERKTTTVIFFSWTLTQPLRIQLQKNLPTLTKWTRCSKRDKFGIWKWKTRKGGRQGVHLSTLLFSANTPVCLILWFVACFPQYNPKENWATTLEPLSVILWILFYYLLKRYNYEERPSGLCEVK